MYISLSCREAVPKSTSVMLHHNCKSNSPMLITNSETLEWASPTSCMHVHGLLTTFPGHWSIQEFPVPLVSDILVCVPAIITYYKCNNHSMSLLPCHWTTQSTKISTLELPVIGINTIFGNPSKAVLHYESQSNTSSHTMATGYWSEPHTDEQSVCMLCMWVPNVCTHTINPEYVKLHRSMRLLLWTSEETNGIGVSRQTTKKTTAKERDGSGTRIPTTGKKPTPIEGEAGGLPEVMNSRGVFKTAEVAAKQFKKYLKQRRE